MLDMEEGIVLGNKLLIRFDKLHGDYLQDPIWPTGTSHDGLAEAMLAGVWLAAR